MNARPQKQDGARGERYLHSPERLAFMHRLSKRLTATAEFPADDPGRQGEKADHKYSLTAEQSRYVFRAPIA